MKRPLISTRGLSQLLLSVPLVCVAAPVTRYDVSVPFEVFDGAPREAVRWTPTAFRGEIDTLVAVVGPLAEITRGEVERWHRLGVRVYAELPAEGTRTNAASAFLLGFDGVVAPPSDARAEGLKDVAAYARLNELACKVLLLRDPDKVWLEGRMGLFQLDRIDPGEDDPDVSRLEAYARIRRLAAFAREPEGVAFDLAVQPRPPIRRPEIKIRRRGRPTKAEIVAALSDRRYLACWDRVFWKYEILRSRSDGERHIGYPNPGIETFCWREYASEKLFMERRFEILKRKYAATADLLPDFLTLREETARLRLAYYLDRFAGRPVEPLEAEVKKQKVELDLDADEALED